MFFFVSCSPVSNSLVTETASEKLVMPSIDENQEITTITITKEPSQETETVIIKFSTPEIKTPTKIDEELTVDKEIKSGFEIGQTIIQAIDSYFKDVGRYPDKLDDLVPNYISEIPKTITDQEYEYFLANPEIENLFTYRLSFVVSLKLNTGCSYFFPGGWECGIKNPH